MTSANIAAAEPDDLSQTSLPLFESQFSIDAQGNQDLSFLGACPLIDSQPGTSPKVQYSGSSQSDKQSQKVQKIRLLADDVPENSEKRTVLEGHVTMATNKSLLSADHLISDNENQAVIATGNVSVETKDSLLKAEKFEGDQKNDSSKLTDVQFHFFSNNANGQAETISFDENNVATLKELTFSTCPVGNDSWRFSANELQLNEKTGWGEAWGMWLKVEGIPVFYFPYLNFPLDDQRKSGFLPPAISNSGRNGLDVSLPVYWNIAPQADATFRPRLIQNRGSQLGVEFRYLTEISTNQLSLEWLSDDKITKRQLALDPDLANGLYGLSKDRWAFSWQNKTSFGENWSASINASRVSDRDYFRDLGTQIIDRRATNSESQILSNGDISYQDDIWQVSLFAESTQSLVGTEPYRIVPSLISSADYYHDGSGIRWQFESDVSRFTHSQQSQIQGSRLNASPSISFPIRSEFAWLTPKASYQISRYRQDNLLLNDSITIDRKLPIISIDSGMIFDRQMRWDNKAVTHSLEPRVFYAYIPFKEQSSINVFDSRLPDFSFSQLWRANRFVGTDRIGDTNHIAFSLTNRFVFDKTGEQALSFSVGKRVYFEDRQVTIGQPFINQDKDSPWLASIKYRPGSQVEFSSFIEWTDVNSNLQNSTNGTNLARSQIKFEPFRDHIVNLSHRIRNKDGFSNEEVDLSFAWPVNDEWRLVGRWYNDLKRNRSSETLFGFEYESCCWALSIVSRRYLDVQLDSAGNPLFTSSIGGKEDEYNSGIQLQFVFKGLGSPGQNGVSKLLENSIRGYRAHF